MIVNTMGSFSEARLIYKISYERVPTPGNESSDKILKKGKGENPRIPFGPESNQRNEDPRIPWGPESKNFGKYGEQYWRSLFTPEAQALWRTGQILYDDEKKALLINIPPSSKPRAIQGFFRRNLALRIVRPKEQKDEEEAAYDEHPVFSNSDFLVKQGDRIMLANKTVLAKRGRFLEDTSGNLQKLEETTPVPKEKREKNKLTYLTLPKITTTRNMETKTYTVLNSKPRLSDLFNTAILEVECSPSNLFHKGHMRAYRGENGEYYISDTRQTEENRVKIVKGDTISVMEMPDIEIG